MAENTSRYQALFTSAIDGIIIINSRGIIQEVNQSAQIIFQYSEKELKGKNINVLMPEPHKKNHDSYISKYHKTGENKIIGIGRNVDGLKKDGTLFPFRLAVSEITEGGEKLFAGVIHDLTKEEEAKVKLKEYAEDLKKEVASRTQQLEESQRMYQEMAKNFPNGTVSILDSKLNILFTEGKEWDLRKKNPKSLIGQKFPEVLHIGKENIQCLKATFQDKKCVFTYSIKNNFYEITSVPINKEHKGTVEILVVETNITEKTQAQLEIENTLVKEKNLHEMKTRFVSMASHEFRTPLSTILSSAILLSKYPSSQQEKTDKHIHRIKSNIQNLNQILDDFLSLDRISAGQLKAQLSSFNLLDLIPAIIEELKPMLKPNQQIITQFPCKALSVFLDKQLIRNILINLLSNAIKYSEEDISLSVNCNEHLEINIIDKGIGIPKREQEQLFQRFFRAENALNIQGTGLGLHIVKRYLDLLKGDIRLISKVNEGTTVQLTFNNY